MVFEPPSQSSGNGRTWYSLPSSGFFRQPPLCAFRYLQSSRYHAQRPGRVWIPGEPQPEPWPLLSLHGNPNHPQDLRPVLSESESLQKWGCVWGGIKKTSYCFQCELLFVNSFICRCLTHFQSSYKVISVCSCLSDICMGKQGLQLPVC